MIKSFGTLSSLAAWDSRSNILKRPPKGSKWGTNISCLSLWFQIEDKHDQIVYGYASDATGKKGKVDKIASHLPRLSKINYKTKRD
jgi:hypothetical protein